MAYSLDFKSKIIEKRQQGFSLGELHREYGVSKSTLSFWLYNVKINKRAQDRLLSKIKIHQIISAEKRKQRTRGMIQSFFEVGRSMVKKTKFSKKHNKFICALLYWCEGNKNAKNGLCFTNSDPELIKTFISLFRDGFDIIEKKFHPIIHLHSYHDKEKQLDFWSKITHINKRQFKGPYIKPNGGQNKRLGYPGCLALVYHDVRIARELHGLAKAFMANIK